MALEEGEIAWFSPDPRGVIPLDAFRIPHGLRKTLKKSPFEIRVNSAFAEVIAGCADRKETWIDDTVGQSFCQLHGLGYAHSVEAWQDGELVGGLYGVAIGSAFFGESMFSRVSGASQAALVALVARLRRRGFLLLDTQWTNPHLRRFGAVDIPKADYLRMLRQAIGHANRFQ
ncbi:leucyl/phenylalanyl-tRNA--protein transferase [soil metagenome]